MSQNFPKIDEAIAIQKARILQLKAFRHAVDTIQAGLADPYLSSNQV